MQKYAVFRIADEMFGITIDRVVEIIKPQKVFSIPGLPDFLCGVMSVRGAVIPLIDLRRRFGLEPTGKKERIIIVRFEREKIGFLVDDIKEIMSLADEEITRPPGIFRGFKTEYITGLGKKNDDIFILLHIDNLLTSEEKILLKESMEVLEERDAGAKPADKR
ncbi:MAG: purine-binding chemotaxis protein CheW [Nitrospirae bacterium]|nr:purine-binding chemotaxis protein CheW [Nitrospirota bacterium]